MQSTQERELIQRSIVQIRKEYPVIGQIVSTIHAQGGTVLLVGGAVRDLLLGSPVNDLDCEVFGISLGTLEHILSHFGPVTTVGKSFGVLKVHNLNADWSMPRTDSRGRKPEVLVDPFMSYQEALKRRDLTINAIGLDLHAGALIDPYDGYADLKRRIVRATDASKFTEDPLRFYRVMRFVGRFEATVDPLLNDVCTTMIINGVARERIEAEFEKLLLTAAQPALGLRWLQEVGRLQEILPELYGTINVPQRSDFHPEGDVFEHAMQTLDAAALIAKKYANREAQLILLYAALCHDLGKQDVTIFKDGCWRSTGHAAAGVPRTRAMLSRITGKKRIIDTVCILVYHHMAPGAFAKGGARPVAYKKLACDLASTVTIGFLAALSLADRRGRNGNGHRPLSHDDEDVLAFISQAKKAGVLDTPEPPLLMGKDFADTDISGAQLGRALAQAYAMQIEQNLHDKEELKQRVLRHFK